MPLATTLTGRSEGDLMAIGDYSYDDKGAVFLTQREPMGDYLSYVERYALSFKLDGAFVTRRTLVGFFFLDFSRLAPPRRLRLRCASEW